MSELSFVPSEVLFNIAYLENPSTHYTKQNKLKQYKYTYLKHLWNKELQTYCDVHTNEKCNKTRPNNGLQWLLVLITTTWKDTLFYSAGTVAVLWIDTDAVCGTGRVRNVCIKMLMVQSVSLEHHLCFIAMVKEKTVK